MENEIDRVRRQNAAEMAARTAAADRYIRGEYPMRADNPCREMTDAQFLAYLRKCRKEFEERHSA